MLKGRTYLGIPDGSGEEGAFSSIISAEDNEAHLTFLATKGPCPIHDENFVPDPSLPEEGEPVPGDPDYQWPIGPFDPDSVLPQQPDNPENPDNPDNGTQPDPGDHQPAEPADPTEPSDPDETDPDTDSQSSQEPEEPSLPEEPALP